MEVIEGSEFITVSEPILAARSLSRQACGAGHFAAHNERAARGITLPGSTLSQDSPAKPYLGVTRQHWHAIPT
jgi:hypothetical protein